MNSHFDVSPRSSHPTAKKPMGFAPVVMALAALTPVILFPGCASTTSTSSTPRLTASEKMMWSTYPLATTGGMATGFVVARKSSKAPGGIVPVVVTSQHVINTIGKGPLYIGARIPNGSSDPNVVLLELMARNPTTPYYVKHPQYDIAAFELKMPPEIARKVPLSSFVAESSLSSQSTETHAGEDVSFLGYPEVLPGTPGAFPVLRSGKVASYSSGLLRNQRKFLVNADAYPGDSGAPVFAIRKNGRPQLLGMLIQRIGPDRKKFVPLALAVDATAIRETLQLLTAHERQAAQATTSRATPAGTPRAISTIGKWPER